MKSLFLSIFMHWMISHNKFISLETCPILCSTCTYANETIVLGGDFNCALTELDKWGARSMELKKLVTEEINNLIIAHDLIDNWRANNLNLQGFTWSNLSMKIQCRLDYLMISKDMRSSLQTVKIIPNVFSDHSALGLSLSFEEKQVQQGPGFWKFNNSLSTDKDYTELISKKIPEFASEYHEVTDKGLIWEMIKTEIRVATILFSKRKAKEKRDKERKL